MSDYERIASAIEYITLHLEQQPQLKDIAGHVNLSPFHFQRLFGRWAGLTPKRFLQVLSVERAKQLLAARDQSWLAIADSVGFGSASRLFDHFVNIEAVKPSDYKRRGRGLTISHGIGATPFGPAFLALTRYGICRLAFTDGRDAAALRSLREEWPEAVFEEDRDKITDFIANIFETKGPRRRPLSLWVRGTNFQISVWRALLGIQPGRVVSYGDVARVVGRPQAVRAVGTAVGANPVALLIPCHRVIRQSGELGGYRWGTTRKHAMHAWEAARHG